MRESITIDPVTRIEGHLAVKVETESGRVVKAYSSGEMFRGFETILKGRHPLDAQQITQRICGVCPVSHGIASILAQDDAYALSPPPNGSLARNLVQAANLINSHIIHFYQLSVLDFIDITAIASYSGKDSKLNELKAWVQSQTASKALYPAAPFLPRYLGDYANDYELNISGVKHYLDALEMRALAHRMGALFGGKLPHSPGLVPGGVTCSITANLIAVYAEMLVRLRDFIDKAYLPDVFAVAGAFPAYLKQGRGCGNFLSFGAYADPSPARPPLFQPGALVDGAMEPLDWELIAEDVGHAYYKPPSGLGPAAGQTTPDPEKRDAYSWIKAPRYNRAVVEVGPLARLMVAMRKDGDPVGKMAGRTLEAEGIDPENLVSVMGRHISRAIECKIVADKCDEWVRQLRPGQPAFSDFGIPSSASGAGLTEAPRGALGHWIEIENGKISNYQCVVPTSWNCSPRDDKGIPGPVEQALEGLEIADAKNPIEAVRVVRSFDPCAACAVH
jgi:Ni,Fe-hydrogenase I large subunit